MAAASPLPAPEARPHSREKGSSKLAGTSRESPRCNRLVTGVRQSHILFVIVRRTVIGFGMALAFISYLDRACISQAAPMIARDLHFNTIQMGYIFSAFGLTYAAMEIPSGWLIDRYGPRLVLTRVVLCWSLFTAATGFAWNFASMLIARLLFGAGEAGCFPGLAKTFSNWLPPEQRARAEGWKACSARWGGAAAPLLVVALYASLGWRVTFVLFGAIGFVWAGFFYFLIRNNPNYGGAIRAS